MKFCNWFGAIPSFDCDFFASSVLFNLLLELEERQRLIRIHRWMHKTAGKAIESASSNICFGYFHLLFNLFLVKVRIKERTIKRMKTGNGETARIWSYKWSACGIWMFLVEVLLKLWKLVQVPVLLSQSFTRVAKLSWRGSAPIASSTTTTKTRRSPTIPYEKERDMHLKNCHLLALKEHFIDFSQQG